jgi:formylglycine-generating enzyme required for sulfatase activity
MKACLAGLLVTASLCSSAAAGGAGEHRATVTVPGGHYRPVTARSDEPAREVRPFLLDRVPVTNAEFLKFVEANPSWRRDRVSTLTADGRYLASWADAVTLGSAAPARAPVVDVSWFAARAYCADRGGRLPTESEWETAAAATPTEADGRRNPAWRQSLLDWYARPNPAVLPDVGRGTPNLWGAVDLHGLVWEWIADFSASIMAGDAARLCGGGATGSIDPLDYPAFLRIAFRSSLEARTTTANLGFRCAYDGHAGREEHE